MTWLGGCDSQPAEMTPPLQQVRGRDLEILLAYLPDADNAYNLRQPDAQIAGSKAELTGTLTASRRIGELRGADSIRPGSPA